MTSRLFHGAALLLATCAMSACDWVVLNPAGDVARRQAHLVITATLLMCIIVVPVIFLILLFAWRYRQSNTTSRYMPQWDHSIQLELIIWAAPLLIIIVLGLITWVSTHTLDPYRGLDRIDASRRVEPSHKPLEVNVVALDWKWLFIYPEYGIASINELAAPVDRPIWFRLTSQSMMNSFYVPAMAGQVYAMPAMQTQLHAVINRPGDFEGFSANYSGAGFSNMRFRFLGLSDQQFDGWVRKAQQSGDGLDRKRYEELAKPSEREASRRFGRVDPTLFHAVLNRCVSDGQSCIDQWMNHNNSPIERAPRNSGADSARANGLNIDELCTTRGAARTASASAIADRVASRATSSVTPEFASRFISASEPEFEVSDYVLGTR